MFPVSWKELCFESVFVPDIRIIAYIEFVSIPSFYDFQKYFQIGEKHGKTLVSAFPGFLVDIPGVVNYDLAGLFPWKETGDADTMKARVAEPSKIRIRDLRRKLHEHKPAG